MKEDGLNIEDLTAYIIPIRHRLPDIMQKAAQREQLGLPQDWEILTMRQLSIISFVNPLSYRFSPQERLKVARQILSGEFDLMEFVRTRMSSQIIS